MKGERSSVASAAKKTLVSGNVLHLYLGPQIFTAGVYEKLYVLTKLKKNKAQRLTSLSSTNTHE